MLWNKLHTGMILIFLISLLTSCSRVENAELAKYWWKYGSGYHQGDVLIFVSERPEDGSKTAWISGDTIYFDNQPELLVTGTKEKSDGHINLYVQSIATGETTLYHGKGYESEN